MTRTTTLKCLLFSVLLLLTLSAEAQNISPNLILLASDVRIEDAPVEGGLFLYVRAKPGINSILLTESAELPGKTKDANTYAFRASEYNIYNSDEKRILNGKFIRLTNKGYFIVDSSTQLDIQLGEVFKLFIPYTVYYGYENTRNGSIDFAQNNAYINIRSFEKKYANYSGEYSDNSFLIRRIEKKDAVTGIVPFSPPDTTQQPDYVFNEDVEPVSTDFIKPVSPAFTSPKEEPVEEENRSLEDMFDLRDISRYSEATVKAFTEIAKKSNTIPVYIANSQDIPQQIVKLLREIPEDLSLDVVIVFDTTRSMWDDISSVKSSLAPRLQEILKGRIFRLGLIYYKDKDDIYELRKFDFTEVPQTLQTQLNSAQAAGGGDWPESVHEALKEAVENFVWLAEERKILLIGDAPPHDPPRDNLNVDQIFEFARARKIDIHPFIVPNR